MAITSTDNEEKSIVQLEKALSKQDIAVGTIIAAVGVAVTVLSLGIPGEARYFPFALSVLLIFLGTFVLLKAARSYADGRKYDTDAQLLTRRNVRAPATVLLLTIAYVVAVYFVGFFPASALFMVAYFLYAGVRGVLKYVLLVGIFLAFIYFLFVYQLNVPVPMGELFAAHMEGGTNEW
ncbi:tripartite tricarboxylate transporter TctB family protein [Arthrobacter sp. EH-1B-1]|uniref:Tripartite tricarboxylate transporter TctB family protein n=1 Tax=Arthrobacter vasquezii TaxID=2977629 RepID=A0ABT6CU57_9MICC|nr:tripartite tricarboxylate transporter TctB family protein [Arthrobacter vasquezii]MDF9277601.1 tripartite tricarboxylate transporter TctB family protein [Arthrobacter vasquezii]